MYGIIKYNSFKNDSMEKCLCSSIFKKRLQYNYSGFRPFWKQRNEGQKLFYDDQHSIYVLFNLPLVILFSC